MRTLNRLKELAVKLTTAANTAAVTGNTVDEVISYIEQNLAVTANGLALKSPDNSVWDISIANDGTISGAKRASE